MSDPVRWSGRPSSSARAGWWRFPPRRCTGWAPTRWTQRRCERIFEAKGRPATSPLIVHVDSIEMARALARGVAGGGRRARARRYWPGPLTLVVPKQPSIPDIVTAGLPTVGLRMPAHPLALALIRAAGVPDRRAQRQPLHGALAHHGRARARGVGRSRRHDSRRRRRPRWASNPPCSRSPAARRASCGPEWFRARRSKPS